MRTDVDRILKQRNALLRGAHGRLDADAAFTLDVWDAKLAETGERLRRERTALLAEMGPVLARAYDDVARTPSAATATYMSSWDGSLADALRRERDSDVRRGVTTVGPHRDEVKLSLDDKSAAQFGSEGQKRTFSIALKMAQAEYLAGIHGSPPILLIDDVMGELDAERRAGLVPLISRTGQALGQVFMTCTEENWPSELSANLHRWNVDQGTLRRS